MRSRIISIICFLLMAVPVLATDRYVNSSSGTDSGDGAIGSPWQTIQYAISNCTVGDTIYLRGGTYTLSTHVDIPATKNGTAWTAGNYTTLCSYPGEWAIITGGGSATFDAINGPNGHSYNKTTGSNPTQYWKFERLEITGCANGIWVTEGPIWVRYCYIHDNISTTSLDEPEAGLWINMPHDCIIEYNYFHHNGKSGGGANYSNIGFDADYRDDSAPTTFDPNHCTRKNIIRYNYIDVDSNTNGIHYKNQQRFGTDTRTSASVIASYSDWGDKIHHNIIENTTEYSMTVDQDNAQVYNNIAYGTSATAHFLFGYEIGSSSSMPHVLNGCFYNNTAIDGGKSYGHASGCDRDSGCPEGSYPPAPYVWFYNNISTLCQPTDYYTYPFCIANELTLGDTPDMTNVIIKNNLLNNNGYWSGGDSPYNNTSEYMLSIGRAVPYTLVTAESTFVSVDNNYQVDTAGLFSSGYITNGSYSLGGSTISNGGIGGDHPYLSGVTLPSYVGAANPSDSDWVAGVLAMDASYFTSQTAGSDPTWIEGSGSSPSTPTISGCVQSGGVTR